MAVTVLGAMPVALDRHGSDCRVGKRCEDKSEPDGAWRRLATWSPSHACAEPQEGTRRADFLAKLPAPLGQVVLCLNSHPWDDLQ